jgi:uncharacterized membrane protein YeiH
MVIDTVAAALDWLGVVAFAISGALVASRKRMDLVGFALLGTVTGIGGGTLRDLLIGQAPVFWVKEPAYLVVCIVASCAVFFTAHIPRARYNLLLWFDAVGLSLFAVTGAERALVAQSGAIAAVAMGVITATFGGIIRDVLGHETPVVLSREIYVTAALVGAIAFVALSGLGVTRELALGLGFLAGFAGARTGAPSRLVAAPLSGARAASPERP